MFLDQFYNQNGDSLSISPEQASRFAKEIAGDFNPIHDPNARRFCVPGDLLFALILSKQGLSQQMQFNFAGMVGRDVELLFTQPSAQQLALVDPEGKLYTEVSREGEHTDDEAVIEQLIKQYVSFSGYNFPFLMVPLMRDKGVMFNPKRPLVMYERMSFKLDRLDLNAPTLELASTQFDVDGKRAEIRFIFDVKEAGQVVGQGDKKLLVGGLMPFDDGILSPMVDEFNQRKEHYLAQLAES